MTSCRCHLNWATVRAWGRDRDVTLCLGDDIWCDEDITGQDFKKHGHIWFYLDRGGSCRNCCLCQVWCWIAIRKGICARASNSVIHIVVILLRAVVV
jgi:hypothetical protein